MVKKPWHSVEWRKKRKEFLHGESCDWCCAKTQLVIHHNKTFHGLYEYKRIGSIFLANHFKKGRNKRELRKLLRETSKQVIRQYYNACTKCGYSVTERKIKKPQYRCGRCKIALDRPIKKETPSSKKNFDKMFSALFLKCHRRQIHQNQVNQSI